MELTLKYRVDKVLSHIKQQLKTFSVQNNDINKIFSYFIRSTTNKKLKYLVEIMKRMDFKGDELIIEPKFENFYLKFFTLAQNIFEDKRKTKEIKIVFTTNDLNPFQEEAKKIIFFYLQFSILVENSIQIFYAFLNPKLCETLLMSKFTHLDIDTLNNSEGLLKSYRFEKMSGELKKTGNAKEIELIDFEPLVKKYLDYGKGNFFDKKIIDNDNKIDRITYPSKLNLSSKNLNNNDKLDTTKIKICSSDIKKSLNGKFSNYSTNKREKEINTDENKNELKKEKHSTIIELKNLSDNQENNINKNELSKNDNCIPKNNVSLKGNSINANKKIEIEQINEIVSVSNQKKNESKDKDNSNKIGLLNKNEINLLKINLFPEQTIDSYFNSQKLKYEKIYGGNYFMKNALKNFSLENLEFKFKSKNIKYYHINVALNEIRNLFADFNNIRKKDYGFFISGIQILFYSPFNSQQESKILYNSKYLKQIKYDDANKRESSFIKYINDRANHKDIIDYFLINGIDIEKNWIFFFCSYFELLNLPNIFFPVSTTLDKEYLQKISIIDIPKFSSCKISTKNKKSNITFKNYISNLFKFFIETDFAKINKDDSDIQPDFTFKPFINEPPIIVDKDANNDNNWSSNINSSNEFKIYGKSIILGEIKSTVPDKILNIENGETINPKECKRALYIVLYKLINKIDYYLNFVKYEILDKKEDIEKYKIQLFLIYNNKPISQMNTYIKTCLDNLIKNGHIHNKFIFQIVYSSPSISSLNINKLSNDIKSVKEKINNLEKENQNLNAKLLALYKEINALKENRKLEKDEKNEQKEIGEKNESK